MHSGKRNTKFKQEWHYVNRYHVPRSQKYKHLNNNNVINKQIPCIREQEQALKKKEKHLELFIFLSIFSPTRRPIQYLCFSFL